MAYIFLTTPTSATGSYMRLMRLIVGSSHTIKNVSDDFYESNNLQAMRKYVPDPDVDLIYVWNTPDQWNAKINLDHYKFLINCRDPRDLVCNQYHWALQHENPAITIQALEAERHRIAAAGIDDFVLQSYVTNANRARYRAISDVVARLATSTWIATTYSQICLDFDNLIDRLLSFFDVPKTAELLSLVEAERTDRITANQDWWRLTGKMAGHDFAPGRYLRELKAQTIEDLTNIYVEEIRLCYLLDNRR